MTMTATPRTPFDQLHTATEDDLLAEAMIALRALLIDVAYTDVYHYVTRRSLYAVSVSDARQRAATLAIHERSLIDLFSFGNTVDAQDLAPIHIAALHALERCELVHFAGTRVSTDGWVVVPALQGLLLTGIPPHYKRSDTVGANAYLGYDSIELARALPPTAGRKVLDLGAGCGVQGLLAVPGATEAVLTDIDEYGLRLARANQLMNDTPHPVRMLVGDGYAPVDGERFDLIATLAPYVPSVEGSAASSTVAGGHDGLGLLRQFIGGATAHLNPGGEFVAIAQLFCDDHGPMLGYEFEELAPQLESRLTISAWHPLQPYLFELASKLAAHGSHLDVASLIERYSISLRPLGITGVCTAVLRLRRPVFAMDQPIFRTIFGNVPEIRQSDLVTLADGAQLNQDGPVAWLTSPQGMPVAVNGPSAALVQAITGTRSIAEITLRAWGEMPGARRADLEDQAISRLRELQSAGLLRIEAS